MEPVDLLAFGPHPDDIAIGMGGMVAKPAALGSRARMGGLPAGGMASNGTVEQRLAEAEQARTVLGAIWRVNLRWPDRAFGRDPEHVRAAVNLIRRARPRSVALPYWSDRHPDHVLASELLTEAIFSSGLHRYETGFEAWKPEWACYYFINDQASPSFVIDVSDHYDTKRRALDCHVSQFTPQPADAVPTR